MDRYCINFILAFISGTAACWSAYSAHRAKSVQTNLIANRDDIYRVCKTIEHLKITLALQTHPSYFTDEEFIVGFEQSNIAKDISILKQNTKLLKILGAFDWEKQANIGQKIEVLEQCRSHLIG